LLLPQARPIANYKDAGLISTESRKWDRCRDASAAVADHTDMERGNEYGELAH